MNNIQVMGVIIGIIFIFAFISVYDFIDSRDWQNATSNARNSLIFQDRNKKYGAYAIRMEYNDTFSVIVVIFSLLIVAFSVVSITFRSTPVKLEVPLMDTTIMTIEAPPLQEMKTLPNPYKIVGGGGGGSAGSPSDAPIDKTPEPQTKKEDVIKDSKTGIKSGKSIANTADNSDAASSTIKKGKSPFGGGAAKGEGTGLFGKDKGPGSGVGNGDGTNGVGSGTGGGGARKKLTNLNPDDLNSNEDCTVHLYVYINSEGNVVKVENIGSKTTTANSMLISKIIELVKKQIKYDKRPDIAQQKQTLTINVKAS